MIAEWHGLLPYQEGLKIQKKYWSLTVEDEQSRIIGCEHPLVVTLGKRSRLETDLLDSTVECVQIDRGGQATLHSPGQLVIYPIFHLRKNKTGVREFVDRLMSVTERALVEYGIQASQKAGFPGLYTDHGKIAFCGLRIDQGVSRHGISINISNDLSLFGKIKSCGIEKAELDSCLLRTQKSIPLQSFFKTWVELFQ